MKYGRGGGARTPDHMLRRHVLYPTELHPGRCFIVAYLRTNVLYFIRTYDHILRRDVLYPAELRARYRDRIIRVQTGKSTGFHNILI